MTKISCGYYCERNKNGICQSKEILIEEDRTCSNHKYDVSKAECGFCDHYDSEEKVCSIDNVPTLSESNCHNSKFSAV